MQPRLRFLSDELIERILDEAYHLLETRGVILHHEMLKDTLADAGCLLDSSSQIFCSTGPDQNICAVLLEGNMLGQFETFAGLTFRF